jgi:DNA-binding NtrC family response regulator
MDGKKRAVSKHVLVLGAKCDTDHNLMLLFRLRGCQAVKATTTEEAINWISTRALVGKPLDLLVVDNFILSRKTRRLLIELSLRRLTTPVLLVNRLGETPAIEKLVRRMAPDCAITLCEPETVFEAMDQVLAPDMALTQGVSL